MSWILMTAVGLGCMWLMRFAHNKVDFVLIRCAAAAFVGAGVIGATGWLGQLFTEVLGWVTSTADALGSAALGNAVVWIIAAFVGIAWIGALLPNSWFDFEYPDWLVVCGFVLPSLLVAVPGQAGEGLRSVILGAGELMNSGVAELI